jgi:hypothetical protein
MRDFSHILPLIRHNTTLLYFLAPEPILLAGSFVHTMYDAPEQIVCLESMWNFEREMLRDGWSTPILQAEEKLQDFSDGYSL